MKKKIKLFFCALVSSLLLGMTFSYNVYAAPTSQASNETREEPELIKNNRNNTSKSGPTDVVVQTIVDNSLIPFYEMGTAFTQALIDPFGPTFYAIYRVENPTDLDVLAGKKAPDSVFLITDIYLFAKNFGFTISTLLVLFFLMICMFGKQEQIRDTPFGLFVKYIVAMVLIMVSWQLIVFLMELANKMWEEFAVSGHEPVTFANFMDMVKGTSEIETVLDVSVKSVMKTLFGKLAVSIVGFFLIWKLLKQFIRLILEVAERYFVFIMMLLLFPAVCPTLISNSTASIFSSYLRMFVSQLFLLLADAVFLRGFVVVLGKNGWTASVFGYVCAFAYVRFCQRLDSYMASMGLNVAQTGGGILESCGGALLSVSSALRTLGSADRTRKNIGAAMMKKGAETQNAKLFSSGAKLNQGISDKLMGNSLPTMPVHPSPTSQVSDFDKRRQGEVFSSKAQNMDDAMRIAQSVGMSEEQASSFCDKLKEGKADDPFAPGSLSADDINQALGKMEAEGQFDPTQPSVEDMQESLIDGGILGATDTSIRDAAQRSGMSSDQWDTFRDEMDANGIDSSKVTGFEQLDGSKQYSGIAGHRQAALDKDGNIMGVIDTNNGSTNVYADPTYREQIDAHNSSGLYDRNYISGKSDCESMFGRGVDSSGIVRKKEDFGLGTQRYTYPMGNGQTNLIEVSSVHFHPENLDDKKCRLVFDSRGTAYTVRNLGPYEKDSSKGDRGREGKDKKKGRKR